MPSSSLKASLNENSATSCTTRATLQNEALTAQRATVRLEQATSQLIQMLLRGQSKCHWGENQRLDYPTESAETQHHSTLLTHAVKTLQHLQKSHTNRAEVEQYHGGVKSGSPVRPHCENKNSSSGGLKKGCGRQSHWANSDNSELCPWLSAGVNVRPQLLFCSELWARPQQGLYFRHRAVSTWQTQVLALNNVNVGSQ